MKQRAAELRAEGEAANGAAQGSATGSAKGAAKREREAAACDEAIAALTGTDQAVAQLLHRVVKDVAPHLDAKTWYGFPSYARDGKVVVFYQYAAKFGTRYGTVGFSEDAHLDAGAAWPTSFAVTEVTPAVEQQLRELVRRAAD